MKDIHERGVRNAFWKTAEDRAFLHLHADNKQWKTYMREE